MEAVWRWLSQRGEYNQNAIWALFATTQAHSKIIKGFRVNPPVPGARAVLLIDDFTVILLPDLSLGVAAIAKVVEWL